MYKIMIYIDTHSGDKWFYYQENEKDYVAYSLHEIKDTVLTLIDTYGKDNIKIVKQVTGEDMEGSVETFIYDSTDNYEELVNRPSINGVEIVGQLSLDDLGIQPAGDYATNEKVDLVEAKVDAIDLEPYATMDYLDEVVAGIDFSSSNENITGVKTFSVLPRSTVTPTIEDELTNKAYVDHGVENCASKEYVDRIVNDLGIPVFEVEAMGAAQYDAYMSVEEGKKFYQYCNEHYGEMIYVYLNCATVGFAGIYSGIPKTNAYGNGIFKLYSNATVYKNGLLCGAHLYVSATMTEDGLFDVENSTRPHIHGDNIVNLFASYAPKDKVLLTNGTTEYTPTSDYHPATKKYVDDSIAAIDIPTSSSNAIEQVETLPSGSEELVGTVYQYIGETNTSYGHVHGNYYICTKKMYLNKHNDRFTSYPWVNAQYENIVKEIPMHEYRNTSGVNFLTPGEHEVWGGTTFNVASDLSKILKRYTSDYNSCLFLYSERLTTDTQEYVSVLFTVSYNTTIDNVQYQVFEGITHSIKNPSKTAHVILRTAINGFNDYYCSPVFIVTEQSGANLDNYYTKEEVDAAIAAAITGALEGEY